MRVYSGVKLLPLTILLLYSCLSMTACEKTSPEATPLDMTDLVAFKEHPAIAVNNLEGPERSAEGSWRWALGPGTVIQFLAEANRDYALLFEASNPVPRQGVVIEVNGVKLREYDDLPVSSWLDAAICDLIPFQSKAGVNEIVIRYKDWNTRGLTFAQGDARPLALAVTRLLIYQRGPTE